MGVNDDWEMNVLREGNRGRRMQNKRRQKDGKEKWGNREGV